MLITILIYILLFLLVALVSGNNLSVCLGAIISGRMISKDLGILLTICGYIAGFLAEGWLLHAGLIALLPIQSEVLIALALGIAMLVFVISHFSRVPQSISVTLALTLVGIGFGYNGAFNADYVLKMILFWIFAVVVALSATIIGMRLSGKISGRWRVWRAVKNIKLMLLIMSFFSAFVLGANSIGFIYAAVSGFTYQFYGILTTLAAIIVGSLMLSRGELNRLGNEILPLRYINAVVSQSTTVILLELATLFSIPAPQSWIFTSSLYGAGISYRTRLIRKTPLFTILSSWIGMALLALLLGFASTYAIYHL